MENSRGNWSSNFGFLMAAVGSAVGLGNLWGFPERAPDYKANQWEHCVCGSDKNNTFFLEIPEEMKGKKIKVYALFSNRRKADAVCNVYICDKH